MRVTLSLKMTSHGHTFVLVQAPLELPAIDLHGDVLEDDAGPEETYVQVSVPFGANTVILFSSRYVFPAKSICPTCEQSIQIFMQIRATAPPNRKLRHIFV